MSAYNEPVTFSRDCDAILVPIGEPVTLPAGSFGFLTQAMGGSFTVYIEGNLFRIAGQDGDAIGKEPVAPPEVADDASEQDIENLIWDQLSTCYDPEIPINIVDLGLVYECKLTKTDNGYRVHVDMTLTAPGCGMGEILSADVREKLKIIPVIEEAEVNIVFEPQWNQSMMSEAARLEAGFF